MMNQKLNTIFFPNIIFCEGTPAGSGVIISLIWIIQLQIINAAPARSPMPSRLTPINQVMMATIRLPYVNLISPKLFMASF